MRITISATDVTEKSLRSLAVALHVHADAKPSVGLCGPVLYSVETPPLTPYQFARVFADLVKYEGNPIIEKLSSRERQTLVVTGEPHQ